MNRCVRCNNSSGLWLLACKGGGALLLVVLIGSLVMPVLAEDTPNLNSPDPAAHLFLQKCSSCHTVGRGVRVGPDLKLAASSTSLDLGTRIKAMEKFVGALSKDNVQDLVQLLKDPSAEDRLTKEQQPSAAPPVGFDPASADVGHSLFSGAQQFKNGGLACISCHRVHGTGGTMGTALTDIAARLGETALASACEEPSYPVMKPIYSNHPITKQEALHLTRYFVSLKEAPQPQGDPPVGVLGFAGAAILLGGIAFFYRNRNTDVHTRLNRR